MNFKDFGQIKKLIVRLEKLEAALDQSKELYNYYEEEGTNYWCCINEYSDGSGKRVDLTGCYVGREVACAVSNLISDEINFTKTEIEQLGVVFEKDGD